MALATAPVARIGVIGSARLARISPANSPASDQVADAARPASRAGANSGLGGTAGSPGAGGSRGSSRCTSAAGRAYQSWPGSGAGRVSPNTRLPALNPAHRPPSTPALTASGP